MSASADADDWLLFPGGRGLEKEPGSLPSKGWLFLYGVGFLGAVALISALAFRTMNEMQDGEAFRPPSPTLRLNPWGRSPPPSYRNLQNAPPPAPLNA